MEEFVCIGCGRSLPIDAFYANATIKCGHDSKCKECRKAFIYEYRAKHHQQILKTGQCYRQSHRAELRLAAASYRVFNRELLREKECLRRLNNPERVRALDKAKRARNPEKYRARDARYRERNRDKILERNRSRWPVYREWRKNNPDRIRQYRLNAKRKKAILYIRECLEMGQPIHLDPIRKQTGLKYGELNKFVYSVAREVASPGLPFPAYKTTKIIEI